MWVASKAQIRTGPLGLPNEACNTTRNILLGPVHMGLQSTTHRLAIHLWVTTLSLGNTVIMNCPFEVIIKVDDLQIAYLLDSVLLLSFVKGKGQLCRVLFQTECLLGGAWEMNHMQYTACNCSFRYTFYAQ